MFNSKVGKRVLGALAWGLLSLVLAAGTTAPAQDVGGVPYKITFVNKSGETGDFCVFQKDPDIGIDRVMSLAWFTRRLPDGSSTVFDWKISYCFVYGQIGKAGPAVNFSTTQTLSANLTTNNSLAFDFVDGTYSLLGPTKPYASSPGSLVIQEGGSVVKGEATVGVGMSGAGTFVVPAEPNTTAVFTPHPKYFVAFGNYKKGQIIDTQTMVGAPEILFQGNHTAVTVTLNEDNTWTIKQD